MQYTINYNLSKPDGTDVVDISVLNASFDKIDSELALRVLATALATVATSGKYSDLNGVPTKLSQFFNDLGYITSAPITSVNNKTGTVNLNASDVGAVPTSRKVNNKELSADITLNAGDVGAAESKHTHKIADITDLSVIGTLNWQDVELQNGCSGSLKYAKDSFGNVWLNGSCLLNTATIVVIGTLPIGFRPSITKLVNVSSLSGSPFTISSDGTIKSSTFPNNPGSITVYFDTCFKAEQ